MPRRIDGLLASGRRLGIALDERSVALTLRLTAALPPMPPMSLGHRYQYYG